MPRPYVAAYSALRLLSQRRSVISTLPGNPANVVHDVPPVTVWKMPTSVPTSISVEPGMSAIALAGASGRLALIFVQLTPRLVVFQTWPDPKPETVAYAISGLAGSTAIAVTTRFGIPLPVALQDVPPFAVTLRAPSLVPT